jgi:ABC-type Fe3+ transport system permease subunit
MAVIAALTMAVIAALIITARFTAPREGTAHSGRSHPQAPSRLPEGGRHAWIHSRGEAAKRQRC